MKAVIFGNISQNLVTPLGAGSLEGRRLRVVVAEVISAVKTAAWLAQLGERRTAVREVESSIPAGPTLRVLKLTEKNMLPFSTSRNG